MREIERTGQFKRDYKREKRADPKLDAVLAPIIGQLAGDAALPERLSDHGLSGPWKGFRDCRIKPDLVLIYEKREGKLSLVRLGSHSELFG
jgi:mRNA interferase YafQ